MTKYLLTLVTCLMASGLPLSPACAQAADPARSSVSVVFKQMGVPVEAPFRLFTADVDFDPAKPAAARARIVIDTKSFDLGGPEYNEEIVKPEWFDTAHYPTASFVASTIRVTNPGQIEVSGALTIKGRSQNMVVPVTYKQAAGVTTYQGSLVVKRLSFNLGAVEWKDTSTLADDVTIKFSIAVPSKK